MKKMTALLLALLFALVLAGCAQTGSEESTGNVYQETYSGTVVAHFTEGGGSDQADCLEVDVGEEGTVIFTMIESTEIIGAEEIAVGDKVEIECESYTDSGYHPALSVTVLD